MAPATRDMKLSSSLVEFEDVGLAWYVVSLQDYYIYEAVDGSLKLLGRVPASIEAVGCNFFEQRTRPSRLKELDRSCL